MKKAKISDGIIVNVIESHSVGLQIDEIDVSSIEYDIGWPVVSGIPIPKPTPFHTVIEDGSGWELTPENAELKNMIGSHDESNKAKQDLKEIDNKSIRSIREFLILRFGEDADFPTLLNDYENDAKTKRSKIK